MDFYTISHASHEDAPNAWIQHVKSGLACSVCAECGTNVCRPSGSVSALLAPRRVVEWPDIIGCGAYPLMVVSDRTRALFLSNNVVDESVFGDVALSGQGVLSSPPYFWIDGYRLKGAAVDFCRSGFVDVRFCSKCNNRTDDVGATYDKRLEIGRRYFFREGSWSGSQIFTTDVSPTLFFITESLKRLIEAARLSNFEFEPC